MQRAGLALARLALALAPHARNVWIACGPGNNGGDGLEAALHLQAWGKAVSVTLIGSAEHLPADAATSYGRALHCGIRPGATPPPDWDLCIDALLGIGSSRSPAGAMAHWIGLMNQATTPVLSADLPSGLNGDTGRAAAVCVRARFSLSLLTLKSGLFTADGRDHAGQVWFNDLGDGSGPGEQHDPAQRDAGVDGPVAWLIGPSARPARAHASHKGSYGDVAVIGGAPGMVGAAVLAASAALHAGAGRVLVGLLGEAPMPMDPTLPELMFRSVASLDLDTMTVVCGCGGADLVRLHLGRVLSGAPRLVLDADGLNAVAADTQLQSLLERRARRGWSTVLTPHPMEAARLLSCTAAQVQQDRLAAAQQLAQRFACTVLLKGSGSIIAAPGQTPAINPSGNPRLASAGTGDVLAGLVGALLAAAMDPFDAACSAAWRHGACADGWPVGQSLSAAALARAL